MATEEIEFRAPGGRTNPLLAAWAPAAKARGGVLVIHENRGLNDHIRTVAGRFAATGYSALALDLLSEEGGTGSFPGEAEVAAALSAIAGSNPQRFTDDMKAALSELKRRVRGKRLAAIGFCFGGGMVWKLLASGEPRLSAAAPFYGPFPTDGDLRGSRNAAVLGVYAGLDDRVNATRDAARAALEAARLRHEILTFTEANHAFFNDTNADRFNAPAAAEAYRRVLDWFDAFVAGSRRGDGQRQRQRLDRRDLLLVRDAERGAATACRDHVRVVDLEAGALQALDVVDDRPVHVGQARTVDEQAQAVVLEDLVAVALRVERERVLEARAAAAAHADAEARCAHVGALGGEELLDLLGALVGEGDHVSVSVGRSNASRSVARSADLARLGGVPTTDELKQRIEASIPGSNADVVDLNGGGDHFRATVVAPEFEGLSRIEQHRRVYAVFGADIGGPIHALSLVTRAEA